VRKLIVLLAATTLATLGIVALTRRSQSPGAENRLAGLSQSYIAMRSTSPLLIPALVTSNGHVFERNGFEGHWSVIFFGFTACPLVCPRTLATLATASHIPESGIASGQTQLFFVSVDPEHDTPKRVNMYLKAFGLPITGLTGSPDIIRRFSHEIGAGYQSNGASIDHSTSLFVIDPRGRLAGVLLRPNEPRRIVADLEKVRLSAAMLDEAIR
jgi:protein SCO1/2